MLVMVCIGIISLTGCGTIKSVETISDDGIKSMVDSKITYTLYNDIVLKDSEDVIVKNGDEYIYDHAKEIATLGKIKDRDMSVADITSSDGVYIGSYTFENNDGIIEYEFKFSDGTRIYNKLAP